MMGRKFLLCLMLAACNMLVALELCDQSLSEIDQALCQMTREYRHHCSRAKFFRKEADRSLHVDKLFYRVNVGKAHHHWEVACQRKQRIKELQQQRKQLLSEENRYDN